MDRKSRTQLYLEKRQKKVLERCSRATGKSVGQLVREAVDETYVKPRREAPIAEGDPIWEYVGAGRSDEKDLSTRHDHYLYGTDE